MNIYTYIYNDIYIYNYYCRMFFRKTMCVGVEPRTNYLTPRVKDACLPTARNVRSTCNRQLSSHKF